MGFFEAMVPKKERFLCISRTHLELTWEPPASIPFLRKLSANHLFLDDRSVSTSESAPLPDGTRLDFSGASENDAHFLVLRVTLRRRNVAAVEGHYPTLTAYNERQNLSTQVSRTICSRSSDITAVLECIHATGADIGAMAPEERVIILPLGETLEVGRQHQLGLFEHLLSAEPRWLGFISRAHVRVQLSRVLSGGVDSGSQHTLRMENLSRLEKGARLLSLPQVRRVKWRSLSSSYVGHASSPNNSCEQTRLCRRNMDESKVRDKKEKHK